MTSSNDPEELEKCRALRVKAYVPKPIAFMTAAAGLFHLQEDESADRTLGGRTVLDTATALNSFT